MNYALGLRVGAPVARQRLWAARTGPEAIQGNKEIFLEIYHVTSLKIALRVVLVSSDEISWHPYTQMGHQGAKQRGAASVHAYKENESCWPGHRRQSVVVSP
jgi:hypothetical protein